jgi:ribosomal protein S18 acetylase RimI-like enzyme
MNKGNETALTQCRFLDESYFFQLYDAFVEAFTDYVVPFALTEVQFRNHINVTAVDLERTAGCFDGEKLVGFSLNGFGFWNGKATVYDAGTGVLPSHRRLGLSEAMFEMMLPAFTADGIEQCVLEVVTTNTGAINLYEKLGFYSLRKLALLQCDSPIIGTPDAGIDIREMREPDWNLLTTFWDGQPSWQNSIEAISRSLKLKRFLGAFVDENCVGYVVFSSKYGRVAQIAVSSAYRNRGIGTALVRAMQDETAEGFSLQVINIDKSLSEAMNFFRKRGFYTRISQFEMVKPM